MPCTISSVELSRDQRDLTDNRGKSFISLSKVSEVRPKISERPMIEIRIDNDSRGESKLMMN